MMVAVEKPESMNLLGLILKSILERNLENQALQDRAKGLFGQVVIQAGLMKITLDCRGKDLCIRRGIADKPRSRISGNLEAFLDVALGGGVIVKVLTGRIKSRGNLFFLLRLLPLMRAPKASPQTGQRS